MENNLPIFITIVVALAGIYVVDLIEHMIDVFSENKSNKMKNKDKEIDNDESRDE